EIGSGSPVSGNFTTIDWGADLHFLKVEMDETGGSNYQLMGTSQLLSVPYALFADSAGAAPASPPQTLTLSGNSLSISGGNAVSFNTNDADADSTNELQTLSIAGNDVTISNGNTITLPSTVFSDSSSYADTAGYAYEAEVSDSAFFSDEADTANYAFDAETADTAQFAWNAYWQESGSDIHYDTGSVGIGVTTPVAKLDIAGDIKITDGTEGAGKVLTSNAIGLASWQTPISSPIDSALYADSAGFADSAEFAWLADTSNFTWQANKSNLADKADSSIFAGEADTANFARNAFWSRTGSTIFYNTGNVGIGTTSPGDLLHVTGTARFERNIAAQDASFFRLFRQGVEKARFGLDANDQLTLMAGILDNPALSVTTTGNVGIGTTSPTAKLHVLTTSGSSSMIVESPTGTYGFVRYKSGTTFWDLAANDSEFSGAFQFRYAAGAPQMVIQTAGNVGIGTTVPGNKLVVQAAVNDGIVLHDGTNTDVFISNQGGFGMARYYSSGVTTTQINSNGDSYFNGGNVGIGTSGPTSKLYVVGNQVLATHAAKSLTPRLAGKVDYLSGGSAGERAVPVASIQGWDEFNGGAFNGSLRFFTESGNALFERMRIESGGRVGIGTTAPDQLFSVNGGASKIGGGSWATFSDRRVKKDVKSFTDGLEVLMQVDPVMFQYNGLAGYNADGKEYVGVIAQEIDKIAPYMIEHINKKLRETDTKETNLLMYDGTALTYILVNAVQEQQRIIENQKNELEQLKAEVSEIKSMIGAKAANE
ncbi:MAG: tail fiber domain-containing protein, partial [Flavobacteriales bacterium]|nr:tail fiber domain-containing protein [Flavobacteriales bacterium]